MRRLLGLVALFAALLAPSPAAAASGLHVAPTETADAAGCHGLDVWNGDQIVNTIPPDDGDNGSCAINLQSSVLPNGRLIFDWRMSRLSMYASYGLTDIYSSDGSHAGLRKLLEFGSKGCGVQGFAVVDQTAYISSDCGTALGFITATRGTKQSTFVLPGAYPGTYFGSGTQLQPNLYARTGKLIVYNACACSNSHNLGRELWVSDGTAKGSHLLRDIWPGPTSSVIRDLVSHGSFAIFTATEGHGRVGWWTNGTTVHKVHG